METTEIYLAPNGELELTRFRSVITKEQLRIPGIHSFGHRTLQQGGIDTLNLHYHNIYEITFVMEGLFPFHIDGKNYTLAGGDILIMPPHTVHSTDFAGELYWFSLETQSFDGFLFLDKNATSHLFEQLRNLTHPIIHVDDKIALSLLKRAFSMAINSVNSPGTHRYTIASYLYSFLQLVIYTSKNTTKRRITKDIEKSVSYISEHFTENILLEDLAAHCNLSVSQFKYKFKYQLGVSPRYFINLSKIEHAKKLLFQGKSKTEVAMELKFSSSAYFSSVFKKFTSLTPSEFCAEKKEVKGRIL